LSPVTSSSNFFEKLSNTAIEDQDQTTADVMAAGISKLQQLTPPNTPSPSSSSSHSSKIVEVEEGIFFTAKTCSPCSSADESSQKTDPFFAVPMPPSQQKPVNPDISPYINQIAESVRQLQDLEERERDVTNDVISNPSIDVDKLIAKNGEEKQQQQSKFLFVKRSKGNKQAVLPMPVCQLLEIRADGLTLTKKALALVRKGRKALGDCLTSVVYARALKFATTVSPAPSLTELQTEGHHLPYLLGRCFNLSLNLKILRGCDYEDHSVAGRCYSDLSALETHLETLCLRRMETSVWQSLKQARTASKKTQEVATQVQSNFTNALRLKPMRKLLKLSTADKT